MVGSGADPGLKLLEWSSWIHSSVPVLADWNNQLFILHLFRFSMKEYSALEAVLAIRDILVWFQIRGSVPLANGSGSIDFNLKGLSHEIDLKNF
jgi:hypothetical protein